MLQEAFKEGALRLKCTSGIHTSKGVKCHVRTSQDLADLRPAKMMKILKKVHNTINADHRQTIDEISEITGLSWSSCQKTLMEDLNMKRVSTKFVPWLLTENQKDNRLNVCYDLREQVGNDPQILSKVETRDETWCYSYDPETKQALSQWKTPVQQKQRRPKGSIKR